jgi:hypothetical protein
MDTINKILLASKVKAGRIVADFVESEGTLFLKAVVSYDADLGGVFDDSCRAYKSSLQKKFSASVL